MTKTKVAIIGSGNIGTDLMFKVIRLSQVLEMEVMAGIDPDSDGLARARRLGLETTHDGVDGLIASPRFDEIEIVFDATSASAHQRNAKKLLPLGKRLIDLTPAAPPPRHEHRASPPCRRVVPPAPRDSHRARPHARRATHANTALADRRRTRRPRPLRHGPRRKRRALAPIRLGRTSLTRPAHPLFLAYKPGPKRV